MNLLLGVVKTMAAPLKYKLMLCFQTIIYNVVVFNILSFILHLCRDII